MNIWLHEEIVRRFREAGGALPEDLIQTDLGKAD
jgi:hypothetical protein